MYNNNFQHMTYAPAQIEKKKDTEKSDKLWKPYTTSLVSWKAFVL